MVLHDGMAFLFNFDFRWDKNLAVKECVTAILRYFVFLALVAHTNAKCVIEIPIEEPTVNNNRESRVGFDLMRFL